MKEINFEQLEQSIPRGRVRTRFAPSPTGSMHVGGLRTALYAYLLAKQNDGDFILRVEDTDQKRLVPGAIDIIYRTLNESGLRYDEGPDVGGPVGPYIQTERAAIYTAYAARLLACDGAYRCFCAHEEAEKDEQPDGFVRRADPCAALSQEEVADKLAEGCPFVIRQRIPSSGSTTFDDLVFGSITVENSELDSNVLIKSDGLPTYNFANVIDDHLMGITHLIRGTEYLSSTPKYNLLYQAFGWTPPVYIHVSPVMKNATQKLSKRHGDPTYDDLIAMGYLREACINYIALLGWSPGGEEEFFTLAELTERFSITGLSKSPAIFDREKLNYFNAHYLRALAPDVFWQMTRPLLERCVTLKEANLPYLANLLQPRLTTLQDIDELVSFVNVLFDYDVPLFEHKRSKCDLACARLVLETLLPLFEALTVWNETTVHDLMMAQAAAMELKTGQIMWPVRTALSGQPSSPGGATELCVVLGQEETLRRMRVGLVKLVVAN